MRGFAVATLLWANLASADPAVWHIAGPASGEVWLLGSVHYLREQDYPMPAVVDSLYEQVDALVMEIDLDDLDPAAVSTLSMSTAMLPPPATLASVIDAQLYDDASAAAQRFGMDLATFDPFKPWLVAITLMDLGMARRGYRSDQGLEQHLMRRAAGDGKTIRGLETIRDQLAVFDGMTMAEQQTLLAQTLGEIDSSEHSPDELVAAWRAGSLDELSEELGASFEEFPRLYQTLVVDRNLRWVPEIENLVAGTERYLVVVGALHLVGDHNVVELLRARGLTVERFGAN